MLGFQNFPTSIHNGPTMSLGRSLHVARHGMQAGFSSRSPGTLAKCPHAVNKLGNCMEEAPYSLQKHFTVGPNALSLIGIICWGGGRRGASMFLVALSCKLNRTKKMPESNQQSYLAHCLSHCRLSLMNES